MSEIEDHLSHELDCYKRHTTKLVQDNHSLRNQLKIANEMKSELKQKNDILELELHNLKQMIDDVFSESLQDSFTDVNKH